MSRSSSVGPWLPGGRPHASVRIRRRRRTSVGRSPVRRLCGSRHTGHGSSAGHRNGPPTELSSTVGAPGRGCRRVLVPRKPASSGRRRSTSRGRAASSPTAARRLPPRGFAGARLGSSRSVRELLCVLRLHNPGRTDPKRRYCDPPSLPAADRPQPNVVDRPPHGQSRVGSTKSSTSETKNSP